MNRSEGVLLISVRTACAMLATVESAAKRCGPVNEKFAIQMQS